MVNEYIGKIANFFVRPLEKYLMSWVYMTVLSVIPNVYCLFFFPDVTLISLLKGIFCDSLLVYCLFLVISLIRGVNEKLSRIVKWTVFCLISIMSAFSLSIHILFSSNNLQFILLAILETSKEEAIDFISVYKWVILVGLCIIFSCIIIVFLLMKHEESREKRYLQNQKKLSLVLSICIMFQFVLFIRYHQDGQFNNYRHLIIKLAKDYQVKNIVTETNSCIPTDSCNFTSSNIILIMGESFNKYHSNLYGYNKLTSPFLSKEENLLCFSNVISPVNQTYGSFSHLLSLASVDQDCAWHDAPLFPYVFKKAGYNVLWWDNQTATCSYIEKTKNAFYDKRNYKKYTYDEELMSEYCHRRNEVERDSNNLIMFHLIGMHYDYSNRYPSSQIKFRPEDYADRIELNEEEKMLVAHYDNAVIYNDSIVSSIIEMYREKDALIIYFSDHGEEINDYRHFDSRSVICEQNKIGWMHCQLDVPFMVYVTDIYREKHPDIVTKIERSVNRPFMIDDLPHLLFHLAGIDNKWYDPKRDLISDSFNATRKRTVSDWCETQFYDYDSICAGSEPWHVGWKYDNKPNHE